MKLEIYGKLINFTFDKVKYVSKNNIKEILKALQKGKTQGFLHKGSVCIGSWETRILIN